MTLVAEKLYSVEEYFEIEARSGEKLEYYDGEINPMPGAKASHNLIAGNTITALNIALEEKEQNFLVSTGDTKIHIPKLQSFVYPDAVVVCETFQFYEGREDTIINPLLIVEVLSPSTSAYDKHGKFGHYKTLPSFQEYVLVEQNSPFVTASYKIAEHTWQDTEADGPEATIYLRSLDVTLSLKRLYKGVIFRPRP